MSDLEATAREALELFGYWQDPDNGWTPDAILREVEEKWPVMARGVLELLEERDKITRLCKGFLDATAEHPTTLRAMDCRKALERALAPKGEGEG